MLKKIEITNFKNFNEKFTFDLSQTNNFNFNSEAVQNGIVNTGVIYGQNGCGKTNLGFAIFDLVSHLTDKYFKKNKYNNYLNANSNDTKATFKFTFLFDDIEVVYEYSKKDYQTLISERLTIDNEEVLFIDRDNSTNFTVNLKGAENLTNDVGDSNISIVSYVAKNTILDKNNINQNFSKFRIFIDNMLFSKTLDENIYFGFEQGKHYIDDYIIKNNKLKNFEKLLNEIDVKCELKSKIIEDKEYIFFKYDNQDIKFVNIASSGTNALRIFYFWYLKIQEKNASFLFIDEFDAFYHHDLSWLVIEMLKKLTGTQIILTTHNTSNISNDLLRPDCYFIMDDEKIQPMTYLTDRELREGHNIEKMYKAGSFE